MKESFFTHVKDGRFTSVPKGLISQFESKRIEVVLQTKNNRSLLQNKFYWGVVILCCQQGIKETQGETISKEMAHSFLKYNCNYTEIVNQDTGEILRIEKESKKLSTIEWEEFIEECRRFILKWFGIVVPMPNEFLTIDFE